MKLVSRWKIKNEVYKEETFVVVVGFYKHDNNEVSKVLGVHWSSSFPSNRGYLSPCVIPSSTRNAMLAGLLHQAVNKGDKEQAEKIMNAIAFLKD